MKKGIATRLLLSLMEYHSDVNEVQSAGRGDGHGDHGIQHGTKVYNALGER